jgi:hypothetical protein
MPNVIFISINITIIAIEDHFGFINPIPLKINRSTNMAENSYSYLFFAFSFSR